MNKAQRKARTRKMGRSLDKALLCIHRMRNLVDDLDKDLLQDEWSTSFCFTAKERTRIIKMVKQITDLLVDFLAIVATIPDRRGYP